MNPSERLGKMIGYGFGDLDTEEVENMYKDAKELLLEIQQLQAKCERLTEALGKIIVITEFSSEALKTACQALKEKTNED